MRSSNHTSTSTTIHPDPLPLCANEDYYRQLASQYPRPEIVRKIRWLLLHVVLGALGLVGLIYILIQVLITNLANEGLDVLSIKNIKQWYVWQLILHYPFVSAGAIAFFLSLIPLSLWMRQDARKEQEALEQRAEGLRMAQVYRTYLEYLLLKSGALPRLLQYDQQTVKSHDTIIFSPLRLAQTKFATIQRAPLDKYERRRPEDKGNLRDHLKIVELQSSPVPNLVVSDAAEALAHAPNGAIVVLGQPGSGKTTLLRHLVWEQAQAQINASRPGGRVPIFLDMAMPDVAMRDFKAAIVAEVEGSAKVDKVIAPHIIDKILQGPSLIVIDGLDELLGNIRKSVQERLEMLTRSVTASTVEEPNNRVSVQIAVSSRVSSFRKGDLNLHKFETWELLPLTNLEAQRQLVLQILELHSSSTLFKDIQLSPDQLLTRLEEQPQTAGWATNPLLLTLATLDWLSNQGNRLAQTRVGLYGNAVEELMKQRMKDWSFQEMSEALWLAEDTALELFQQGRRSLTMQSFSERIIPRLSPRLVHRTWGSEKIGPGDVLLIWSGLFVLDSNGQYDIYHLTFLEFLAARALARQLVWEWSPKPVISTEFLVKLNTQDLLKINVQEEVKLPQKEILAHLWLKRTSTRWNQVLMMMTGVLNEQETADKLIGNLARPDLARAWIRALLDQPDDVGLLGLRLATGCAAEMGIINWNIRELVLEITDRLVEQLCQATLDEREFLTQALQRACHILASGIGQEAMCESLLERLIDPNERIRKMAAETLGLLGVAGKLAIPKLLLQLADSNPQVRKSVAEATIMLGEAGVDVLHYLVPFLNDANPGIRVAIIQMIGRLGPDGASALDRLSDILANDSEHSDVCQAIVEAIGNIGQAEANALNVLFTRLADGNTNVAVRIAIVDTISRIEIVGVNSLQNLLVYLTDPDWRVRTAVVNAIGNIGSIDAATLDIICTKLTDKNENIVVRQSIAWAIGTLGSLGATALNVLCARLEDDSEHVAIRQAVARAIGTLGLEAASVLDALHALLANENVSIVIRQEVAEAIGRIGTSEIYVLSCLVPHLTDSHTDVRVAVVKAIGTLGYAAVSTLEVLANRLADESEDIAVRQAIVGAIGEIGTVEVDTLPYLVPHLTDSNPNIRIAVVEAIGILELDRSSTLPQLCLLLKDADTDIREATALVLGRYGKEAASALPALIERINDHEEDVRVAIHWAIGKVGAAGIPLEPALAAGLAGPNWQVKRTSAGIVKAIGLKAKAVLPELQELLAQPDQSAAVREKVAQAIGAFGTAAGNLLPSLINWLSDPEWRVREATRRSLKELDHAGLPIVEHLSYLMSNSILNTQVAIIEAIKALADSQEPSFTELLRLIPELRELLAHTKDWHVQQATEEAIRALQIAYELETVSGTASQPKDLPPPYARREIEFNNIAYQLRERDWKQRELAIQEIASRKPPMEWAAPLLLEALADPEPTVSDMAAIVLADTYSIVLTDKLLKDLSMALEGRAQGVFLPFVQRNELDVYLALDAAAYPFLNRIIALLDEEHWSVRENAARALSRLRHNSDTTMRRLLRLYKEDASPAVRKAADEALTAILSFDESFGEGINETVEFMYQNG